MAADVRVHKDTVHLMAFFKKKKTESGLGLFLLTQGIPFPAWFNGLQKFPFEREK